MSEKEPKKSEVDLSVERLVFEAFSRVQNDYGNDLGIAQLRALAETYLQRGLAVLQSPLEYRFYKKNGKVRYKKITESNLPEDSEDEAWTLKEPRAIAAKYHTFDPSTGFFLYDDKKKKEDDERRASELEQQKKLEQVVDGGWKNEE